MSGPVTGPSGRGGAISAAGATPDAAAGRDAKLRSVARQMEGSFVLELYKAMRATVPQGEGVVDGGSGEELFTSLMDQHLAVETPQPWARGLGDAIYRHLRGRVDGDAATPPPIAPPQATGR